MKQIRFKHFLFLSLFLSYVAAFTQPAGYYDAASGQTGEALQTALYNIIDNHVVRTYDQLWTDFQSTDAKANGKVWDMYSDVPGGSPAYEYTFITDQCGNYDEEGDCYNREHSIPASWFNDALPMYADLFHLIPTDGYVNNKRSNYPFGEVGSTSWTSTNGSKLGSSNYPGYSGTVFEPIDEYKGDIARNYLYMATRYKNVISSWSGEMLADNSYPVFTEWALNMLLEWHTNDPVSQKEIDRNNAIYAIQQNRNPFIDHPEYANLIWGTGLLDEPTNHVTDFSANTITLQWTDAVGTVLPDAYLIKMSSTGFNSITAPVDGTAESDGFWTKNVTYGIEKAVFGNLSPGTTYYFKMWGYTGSEAGIDYKTDGEVLQISLQAP